MIIGSTAAKAPDNIVINLKYFEDLLDQESDEEHNDNPVKKPEEHSQVIPFEKKIQLEDAKTLEAYNCKSDQMRKLTDQIFEEVSRHIEKDKKLYKAKKYKKTLNFLLKNLLIAHFERRPLRYSRNKSNYSKNTRLGKMFLTYQITINLIQALEELGYVEHDIGFYNHEKNYGRETRISATPKLYMKIAEYKELKKPGCFVKEPPKQLIILRDENYKNMTFKHTPMTLNMEKELEQYNHFVSQHQKTIYLDGQAKVSNGFITETLKKNLYTGKIKLRKILIDKRLSQLSHPDLRIPYWYENLTQSSVREMIKDMELFYPYTMINLPDIYEDFPEYDYQILPIDFIKESQVTSSIDQITEVKLEYETYTNDQYSTPSYQDYQYDYDTYQSLYQHPYDPYNLYHPYDPLTDIYIQTYNLYPYQYPFSYNSYTNSHIHTDILYTYKDIYEYPIEDTLWYMTKKDCYNPLKYNEYHDQDRAVELLLDLIEKVSSVSRFLQKIDSYNKHDENEDDKKKYGYKSKNNRRFIRQEFLLEDFGIEYLSFDLVYEYSHRVFGKGDETFQYNGRSYGPVHQNISKDLRKHIRINGEPTVELDFSSMHPRMLYHLEGIDYRDNLYEACDGIYLKKTFKQAILIAINAEDVKTFIYSLRNKMREKKLPWPHKKEPLLYIVDRIKEVHKSIAHKLYSNAGIKLMGTDSKIMNNILMSLMEKGICGLSVHDSVIVAERHRDTLHQVMIEEYKKIMKFDPVID